MAQASSILFVLGAIALAIGFAAHVGHAVLLANGRRLLAFSPARQPAFAAAGVSGSFVTARAAAAGAELDVAASPSPLSRVATVVTVAAFALLLASMLTRAIVVGRD